MKRKAMISLVSGALLASFGLTACGGGKVAETYDGRAKSLGVRRNMVIVQDAAERYFKDHTYMYPTTLDDEFKSYFPGGDPATKKPGNAPTNPFTGVAEWPSVSTINDLAQARNSTPTDMKKGALEYNVIEGGKNYGIKGGGDTGKAMRSEDPAQQGTLVLSRDNYEKPAQ